MKQILAGIVNQFVRIRNDDGRNDKNFDYQEHRLKVALTDLKNATDEVIKWSGRLQDLLTLKEKPRPEQMH